MTKEELEKYAHENRKRLDAQEVKIGDVVKVLRGQFAGETGVIVGIIVCGRDYADPYYEVDMDCEVPDKYKCRKNTLAPNNVIGGLSAYEFEVIGNRAPMQSTEEIKVGDKVRVSKDAPRIYTPDWVDEMFNLVLKVTKVEDGNAMVVFAERTSYKTVLTAIPTKYLIKVEDEAKEPKFKVGDVIDTPKGKGTVRISYGDYWVVHLDNGEWYIYMKTNMPYAPYTEPKEQAEGKEPKFHIGDIVSYEGISGSKRSGRIISNRNHSNLYGVCSGIDIFHVEEEALNLYNPIKDEYISPIESEPCNTDDTDWNAYAADLAHDLALKVANKYSDPTEAADYAVSVAKAVVENLKKE